MLTKGAHHVSLTVSDIDRARGFYEGVLGLSAIERPELGLAGAWYQIGTVQLHLIEPPAQVDVGTKARQLTPLANHLALEIEDYEAVRDRLEAEGVEVIGLGAQAGQLFACDPDGNVLEFIQPKGG